MQDQKLVKNIQFHDCNNSLAEIIKKHEPLFIKVCQRYAGVFEQLNIDFNDIIEERYFVIYRAIKNYNFKKKMKISTWIGNYARYHCLNSINNKKRNSPRIENYLSHNEVSIHSDYKHVLNYTLNVLSKLEDKRAFDIFKLRYGTDKKLTWTQIGEKMKLSSQTCLNIHNKNIRHLKNLTKDKDLAVLCDA